MSAFEWVVVVLAVIATFCAAMAWYTARQAQGFSREELEETLWQGVEQGRRAGRSEILAKAEGVTANPRPEIVLADWGPEHGDMRWRWTIWEADRALDVALWPEAFTENEPGTMIPWMLGNAPTRPMAEAEALAWLRENRPNLSFVLTEASPA